MFPAAYVGSIQPVRNHTGGPRGSVYIQNQKRHRRPLQPLRCPFCAMFATGPKDGTRISRLSLDGIEFWVLANINPILVEYHWLVVPRGPIHGFHPECRFSIQATDVRLIVRLVTEGFEALTQEPLCGVEPLVTVGVGGIRWSVYVNPLPGTGRSLEHLHLNLVNSDDLSLPEVSPAYPVCSGEGRTMVSAADGLEFPTLLLHGGDVQDIAATVERLNVWFNETWRRPYNLLAFPRRSLGAAAGEFDLLIIPRGEETAKAVGQRIAGLELFSGVLLPATEFHGDMTAERRDAAFREATLGPEEWLTFIRQIREAFPLPTSTLAVVGELVPEEPARRVSNGS